MLRGGYLPVGGLLTPPQELPLRCLHISFRHWVRQQFQQTECPMIINCVSLIAHRRKHSLLHTISSQEWLHTPTVPYMCMDIYAPLIQV